MNKLLIKYTTILLLVLYLTSTNHMLVTHAMHFSIHTIEYLKTRQHINYHHHFDENRAHTHSHQHLNDFEFSFHHKDKTEEAESQTPTNDNIDKHIYSISVFAPKNRNLFVTNFKHSTNTLCITFIEVPFPPPRA